MEPRRSDPRFRSSRAPPEETNMPIQQSPKQHYDVVIIGAGMAGLTLSRQLLLYTNKSILLIDKIGRAHV